MAKIVLNKPTSGYNLAAINDNFVKIEAELQNKVAYRDNPVGEPNAQITDIDMNGKRIYNLPAPVFPTDPVRLVDLPQGSANPDLSAAQAAASAVSAAASATAAQSSGSATALKSDLASSGAAAKGAGLVGWFLTLTGFVGRTVSAKLSDSLSVRDFGALGSPKDDSAAFQSAINALPALGGKILVPDGAYTLNTQPTTGAKSIYWDFGPNCVFSGTATVGNGSFPRAVTNISMLPNGPFIQSKSAVASTAANATGAFVLEVLQPTGFNGGTVGIYSAAKSANSGTNSNAWATNFLVKSDPGATGGFWGLEIDVNSDAAGAVHFGLDITGIGTVNPQFGLLVQRADATVWNVGVEVRKASVGINLAGSNLTRGIVVNNPIVETNSVFSGKALANNSKMQLFQRFTDTSPTGYFQFFVNAANSAEIFSVDVLGNVAANTLAAKGASAPTFAGALAIGATTGVTATAGGTNLPATAAGFLNAFLGATPIRIPFYSA